MAISKFTIQIPDLWVTGPGTTAADKQPAKLGHINRVVNYINTNLPEKLEATGILSGGDSLELTRIPDPITLVYPETPFLAASTAYLVPKENSCVWQVTVDLVVLANTAAGTIAVGDSFGGKYVLLFKRINGTSTLVNVVQALSGFDDTMVDSEVTFAVGAAQDLRIAFIAPTAAAGISFDVKATVSITQAIL
jgi:hypothetical protein